MTTKPSAAMSRLSGCRFGRPNSPQLSAATLKATWPAKPKAKVPESPSGELTAVEVRMTVAAPDIPPK
ncbi:UNVERIFIED_ORG: hypothetical protein M2435_004417 [Rhizobium sophorae]|nr:hypothetical protein [Rhizobium leguminosarum]MDH6661496.1 hypothetical protein [Rhizobium sophorae]